MHSGGSSSRGGLGSTYWARGDRERGPALTRECPALSEQFDGERGQSAVLVNLGIMCRDIGDPGESLSYLKRRIATVRELKHRNAEANTLDEFGVT